jgi:DNA-binding MarR family transcriptional regulator
MPGSRLSNEDFKALAELRLQIRRYLHFSEQAARRAGLEPQQQQMLLALKGLPAGRQPAIGEMARRLQLRHHSAVELADRMAARRLVKRARSADDARVVLLKITPKGERLLHDLSLVHREELRGRGPGLLKALRALLAPKG